MRIERGEPGSRFSLPFLLFLLSQSSFTALSFTASISFILSLAHSHSHSTCMHSRVFFMVMHWTPVEVWNLEYERIRANWNFTATFFTIVLIPHDPECPENDLSDCRLILKPRKCYVFLIILVARLMSQLYFITWNVIFRFISHWQMIVFCLQTSKCCVLERIIWFSTFFYLNSDYCEFLRLLFSLDKLSHVSFAEFELKSVPTCGFVMYFSFNSKWYFLFLLLFAAVILCKWFWSSRSSVASLRSTRLAQLQLLNLAIVRILGLARNFPCLYNSNNCVFLWVSFNSSSVCRQVAWPIKSGALGQLFCPQLRLAHVMRYTNTNPGALDSACVVS